MAKLGLESEMAQVEGVAPPRQAWTSQRAYILASIAGVVGLGNLWRFPYMAGENGGGVFVVAYVISMAIVGISLHIVETSAGKLSQLGPVGLFRQVNSKWGPWFGWLLVIMLVLIMSYYLVISGWTLGYAVDSIRFDLKPFEEFTAGFASLWYLLVIAALTFIVLLRGIGGLELTSKFLLPLLVLTIGGLAIYTQFLPGAAEARQFYFSFDPKGLLEPDIWRMAVSQSFYSLGIGQAFLIAYGSYSPPFINKLTASWSVALTNSAISIVAGLMIFPIVFTFGLAPDTGSQLSFVTFPRLLDELPGGQVIGIGFYILLFVAAFTSCAGGLAAIVASLRDQLGMSLRRAALVATVVTTVIGIPSALSFTSVELNIGSTPFLDVMDQLTGSGVVIIAGIAGAALITWMIPKNRILKAINARSRRIGPLVLSPSYVIYIGRYLPVAAALLWLVTYLV